MEGTICLEFGRDGDQDEFDDNWQAYAKQLTNMGPQLDKGIDVWHLLNNVFPLEVPPIGLKDSSGTPSMPINVGMNIAKEVQ